MPASVEFMKGLQPVTEDKDFFSASKPSLLITDVLALSICNNERRTKIFTQGIHHQNLSVILILQNL